MPDVFLPALETLLALGDAAIHASHTATQGRPALLSLILHITNNMYNSEFI